MPNTIFSSEGALLFIMVATVALGFWLQRFKAFKTLGPALTVIVMGIVMSNLRIVPTSSATYDAISSYCVPLSVSICLLSLDLKQMRKLSKEPVIALASAVFSVCVAALVFGVLFAGKIDEGWKVAGMFVGTYTGGSSNLTAIAVGLEASKTTIASANAADYVVGIPTLILMFAAPALYKNSKRLKKLWPYEMSEPELLGDGDHEELMASKEWSIQEIAWLQSINKQYYDAAKVDGTPRRRVFTHITVPLLSPMLAYVIITGFIGGFKEYTSIVGIFGENMGPPDDAGRLNTMVGFIYDALETNSQGRASAALLSSQRWRLSCNRYESGIPCESQIFSEICVRMTIFG